MSQLNWQKSQLIILGGYSFAIAAALLFLLTKPNKDRFPKSIVLDDWSAVKTNKLSYDHEYLKGRRYSEPKQHDLVMEVFLIPISRGDNLNLINRYLKLKLESEEIAVKSDSQIGSYGLFTQGDRVHLNTCIHSDGRTAFTPEQFSKLVNDNLRSRLLPWIFGLTDLRDWSCFWVNLTVSMNDLTEEETAQMLRQKLFALVSETKFD